MLMREVVKKIRDAKGFVVSEILSCGHLLDVTKLKPGKTERKCPTCVGEGLRA